MRAALFTTCLVDAMRPVVGQACVRLLRRLGVDVDVPRAQTCCGQMHVNSGYPSLAMPMIRNEIDAFAGYDAVVAPSASCVGTIRHQQAMVAYGHGDPQLARDVEELAGRTYELSEFLVDVLGVRDVQAHYPHRVTFHPTCHSLRVLRVGDRPLELLRHVEGLELVELPDAQGCCGFGGTFALKNSAVSSAMLADKVAAVRSTGASVCSAGDSSCLLHIGGGLSRVSEGADAVRPVHLVEILASTRDGWE